MPKMVKNNYFSLLPLVNNLLPLFTVIFAASTTSNPSDQSRIRQFQVRVDILPFILTPLLLLATPNLELYGGICKKQGTTVGASIGHGLMPIAQIFELGCAHWHDCFPNSRANHTNLFKLTMQESRPNFHKFKAFKLANEVHMNMFAGVKRKNGYQMERTETQ